MAEGYRLFIVIIVLLVLSILTPEILSVINHKTTNQCVEMAKNISCKFFDKHYDEILKKFPDNQVCQDYLYRNKTVECSLKENGR